jgi:hypothetical protein
MTHGVERDPQVVRASQMDCEFAAEQIEFLSSFFSPLAAK